MQFLVQFYALVYSNDLDNFAHLFNISEDFTWIWETPQPLQVNQWKEGLALLQTVLIQLIVIKYQSL